MCCCKSCWPYDLLETNYKQEWRFCFCGFVFSEANPEKFNSRFRNKMFYAGVSPVLVVHWWSISTRARCYISARLRFRRPSLTSWAGAPKTWPSTSEWWWVRWRRKLLEAKCLHHLHRVPLWASKERLRQKSGEHLVEVVSVRLSWGFVSEVQRQLKLLNRTFCQNLSWAWRCRDGEQSSAFNSQNQRAAFYSSLFRTSCR